jgi:glycine betaine/proline transport system ATP-binding protein
VVSVETLRQVIETDKDGPQALEEAFLPDVASVTPETHLQDVLPIITRLSCPVPVVDEKGKYQGAISKNRFLKTLRRDEAQPQKQQEEELENS